MFYLLGFSHIIVIRKAPLPPIITFSLKRWENLEFWREWDVAKDTFSEMGIHRNACLRFFPLFYAASLVYERTCTS